MALQRVRIVTDPRSPVLTKVYDADTGEQIQNVMSVALAITGGHHVVRLELAVAVAYEGPAEIITHPIIERIGERIA